MNACDAEAHRYVLHGAELPKNGDACICGGAVWSWPLPKDAEICQVFVDGAPTRCEWGLEPFECDAWHLCGDCYRALMDGTRVGFTGRRGRAAQPVGQAVPCP